VAAVEGGKVKPMEEKAITGEELRKNFSVLKYHSLKEDEKKDLLEKTFGIARPDEDRKKTPAELKAEMQDLTQLRGALKELEAYKAYRVLMASGNDIKGGLAQIALNHRHFRKADAQIEAVQKAYEELLASPDDGMAAAKLAVLRREMKQTLKDDVMGRVLTEGTDTGSKSLTPPVLQSPLAALGAGLGLHS
jgi:hypothetical protein